MKLAEALILRADVQKRISQLRVRLNQNAKVQEGDSPAEMPETLLNELNEDIDLLQELIKKINKTNSTIIDNGETITDIIAKKDTLTLKASIIRDFLSEASDKIDRYSNKEIKIISTVNVSDMQKHVDTLSKQIREIDTRLQGINWTTDIIE